MFQIRAADAKDIPALERAAAGMGGKKQAGYFERCLAERLVFLAEDNGEPAGFVMLNWSPLYAPFRSAGIPEIQDLGVTPDFRRRGIGAALIAHCENAAKAAGKAAIGVGVGLHGGFGAAQRLYAAKGYMPDGAGAVYDETPVRFADIRPVDDLLNLKMLKSIL